MLIEFFKLLFKSISVTIETFKLQYIYKPSIDYLINKLTVDIRYMKILVRESEGIDKSDPKLPIVKDFNKIYIKTRRNFFRLADLYHIAITDEMMKEKCSKNLVILHDRIEEIHDSFYSKDINHE